MSHLTRALGCGFRPLYLGAQDNGGGSGNPGPMTTVDSNVTNDSGNDNSNCSSAKAEKSLGPITYCPDREPRVPGHNPASIHHPHDYHSSANFTREGNTWLIEGHGYD